MVIRAQKNADKITAPSIKTAREPEYSVRRAPKTKNKRGADIFKMTNAASIIFPSFLKESSLSVKYFYLILK